MKVDSSIFEEKIKDNVTTDYYTITSKKRKATIWRVTI